MALILESKKIRFNNLNDVDDILEGSQFEKSNLAQHIFVSSWTKDSEENIALWKMYTDAKGIRIALPDYPWIKNNINTNEWTSKGFTLNYNPSTAYHSPFQFDDIFADNYMICPPYFTPMPGNVAFAKDVKYLDEVSLKAKYIDLYKESINKLNNKFEISMAPLEFGLYKHKRWEFQKEFRFVLFIVPLYQKPVFIERNIDEVMLNSLRDHLLFEKISPIKDFFVKLSDESIKEMEITMGPLTTNADEINVKSLLKKHGISTTVYKSNSAIRK